MAILRGSNIKKEINREQKVQSGIPVGSKDPNYTDEAKAKMALARLVIWGVLILIGVLVLGLFLLISFNNQSASVFKDIVSTFIAVASGILGSILGYYYKNNEK